MTWRELLIGCVVACALTAASVAVTRLAAGTNASAGTTATASASTTSTSATARAAPPAEFRLVFD